VGDLGSFDPATGEGSVTVPDVAPGLWAVAAACVGPVLDLDLLEAGIRENGAFFEEIGSPLDLFSPEFEQFAKDFTGDPDATVIDFLTEVGPTLVQSIVQPDALGVQIFCVLDAEGRCPADTPPPGQEPPAGPPSAPPARPIPATPDFTG
jgi:hypothetical protein